MNDSSSKAVNVISACCWIPRGKFATSPTQAPPPSKKELEKILQETEDNEDDIEIEENEQSSDNQEKDSAMEDVGDDKIDDDLKEYNLDNYDEEEGLENLEARLLFNTGVDLKSSILSDEKDEYMTGKDSDSDSDKSDYELSPDDLLVLSICNEENITTLQVHVYEEEENNMFLHHDVLLRNFGLCVEWLDFKDKSTCGNFAAVGTFDPCIEIWDMDIIDPIEPVAQLGELPKKKKRKSKIDPRLNGPHSGAILGLSWNTQFRNFIASASDDHTVKVWDIATQKCQTTLCQHTDKVQCIQWNPKEHNLLLSGSFDKRCALMDPRNPKKCAFFKLKSDIESMQWDPHNPQQFAVSMEDGHVLSYDARKNQQPIFLLKAHNETCTSLAFCPVKQNIMVTGSTDKTVKMWSINNGKPELVKTNISYMNPVYSLSFLEDKLSVGGDKGGLKIWKMDFKSWKDPKTQ